MRLNVLCSLPDGCRLIKPCSKEVSLLSILSCLTQGSLGLYWHKSTCICSATLKLFRLKKFATESDVEYWPKVRRSRSVFPKTEINCPYRSGKTSGCSSWWGPASRATRCSPCRRGIADFRTRRRGCRSSRRCGRKELLLGGFAGPGTGDILDWIKDLVSFIKTSSASFKQSLG